MKFSNESVLPSSDASKTNHEEKLEPKILLAGKKAELLGLVEPVHMCSNCWNNKVHVN